MHMADRLRGTTRLAGVIGWPVEHSRSPQMHNAAFDALGMDWAYVALPVAPDRLEAALRGLPALGFAGVNVTIPHKEPVAELCDTVSDEARRAGSVNTVIVGADGGLRGELTDGRGVIDELGEIPRERAVVLGAGGAARAVIVALADAGHSVDICARDATAAAALADELGVGTTPWPLGEPVPLLVNATPVGQRDEDLPVDEELLSQVAAVCDLAYRGNADATPLIHAARRQGARTVDGIDVLVGQGVHAFRLFTGVDAPVDVMRVAARAEATATGSAATGR
jgi:shikimate dehydrogenase